MTNCQKIKMVCCDIDGTLTDGTVFYSAAGEEFKQFSHRDGRAFHLLKFYNVIVVLITSEECEINEARGCKFLGLGTVDQYISTDDKKEAVLDFAQQYGMSLSEILYIGDDTNDAEAMDVCGYNACPVDARPEIVMRENIIVSRHGGGKGAVRDIIDTIIAKGLFEEK